MSLLVKICGLSTPAAIDAAVAAGADCVGLVFHPRSPRYVALDKAAALAARARDAGRGTQIVAMTVDAGDLALDAIRAAVDPDLWQLHGAETPARLKALKARLERPVMKAVGVAAEGDLAAIAPFRGVADRVLIDSKPPKDAAYPGGHGKPFDWTILADLDPAIPFMLSGGLDEDNVGTAIARLRRYKVGLAGVDVSSGVESAPGVKDAEKIMHFVAAVRRAA